MPQLDPRQFYNVIEKSIAEDQFSPIYFFYGDEPYLIQQAYQFLRTSALNGVPSDFNFNMYFSSEAEIQSVKDEVETLPMMAHRRVVMLREVEELSDRDWELLRPIIENPVSSTVMILVGGKIDKRKKIFKLLLEQSTHVEFHRPFENQIPGWITQISKAHGMSIRADAVQLVQRLVGNHLFEIESELKKLKEFCSPRTDIQLEDVAQCVSSSREESVFALTASIARGDRSQSLIQIVQLLDQGQNEMGLVSLVARHIRILLMIKSGQQMGLAGQRLAIHAQVPNYYLMEYVEQARQWTVHKLEMALLVLSETDKAIKSSPLSTHIWLENMVLRTCALHKESHQQDRIARL